MLILKKQCIILLVFLLCLVRQHEDNVEECQNSPSTFLSFPVEMDKEDYQINFDPMLPLSPQANDIVNSLRADVKGVPRSSLLDDFVVQMEQKMSDRMIDLTQMAIDIAGKSHLESLRQANDALEGLKMLSSSPHLIDEGERPFVKEFKSALQNNKAFVLYQIGHFANEAVGSLYNSLRRDFDGNNGVDATILANDRTHQAVTKSNFENFENIYEELMAKLSEMAVQNPSEFSDDYNVEGGLWVSHGSGSMMTDNIAAKKRECLMLELFNVQPKIIGEIGFNAGHSSGMYLSVFESAKVYAFDICRHRYTELNANYLKAEFGTDRIDLTCGDSLQTLRDWDGAERFDYFFVDGNHDFEFAYGDILNACNLMAKGGTIAVDDCNLKSVRLAWLQAEEEGVVKAIHDGLCWIDTCFGVCL